ncbi:hypothetical protein LJC63_10815 [Ruminococcaceae bacterium OttesenSCG-928-L11]|nr:hypothetical protein [Ruminococcaceae bacterium OttesenSCG-928-L11]
MLPLSPLYVDSESGEYYIDFHEAVDAFGADIEVVEQYSTGYQYGYVYSPNGSYRAQYHLGTGLSLFFYFIQSKQNSGGTTTWERVQDSFSQSSLNWSDGSYHVSIEYFSRLMCNLGWDTSALNVTLPDYLSVEFPNPNALGQSREYHDWDFMLKPENIIDFLARMIFHEDGNFEGQAAIAWTIHNRIVMAYNNGWADDGQPLEYDRNKSWENIPIMLYNYYARHMRTDDLSMQSFWKPHEKIEAYSTYSKWYAGDGEYYDPGTVNSIQASWENAVMLASYLYKSLNDTELFNSYVSNPFTNYPDSFDNPNTVIQYVGLSYGYPGDVRIGNNWFKHQIKR